MNQYDEHFEQWMKDCAVFERVIIDKGFEKLITVQALLFFCWLKSLENLSDQKKWADAFGKWAHHELHKVELHFKESFAYDLMLQWNEMKENGKTTTPDFLAEETDLLANPVLEAAFNSALETFLDQENIHWLVISHTDLSDWDFHPGMIIGWADGSREEQGVVLDIRIYDGMIFFLIRQKEDQDPVIRMAAIDGEFENGLITPKHEWLEGFLSAIQKQGIH